MSKQITHPPISPDRVKLYRDNLVELMGGNRPDYTQYGKRGVRYKWIGRVSDRVRDMLNRYCASQPMLVWKEVEDRSRHPGVNVWIRGAQRPEPKPVSPIQHIRNELRGLIGGLNFQKGGNGYTRKVKGGTELWWWSREFASERYEVTNELGLLGYKRKSIPVEEINAFKIASDWCQERGIEVLSGCRLDTHYSGIRYTFVKWFYKSGQEVPQRIGVDQVTYPAWVVFIPDPEKELEVLECDGCEIQGKWNGKDLPAGWEVDTVARGESRIICPVCVKNANEPDWVNDLPESEIDSEM